jgi:uncharacterized protein (DUF302 family)
MKTRFLSLRLLSVLALFTFGVALASPASAQTGRVSVASQHSFDQTISALKSAVGQGGMMVMATVDQGNMLSMTGLRLKATLFLVGNPTVGKKLFEQNHAVGLYVPLRVFVYEDNVYEDKDGKTYVSYDKPSELLGQLNNPEIDQTARMLDEKLDSLVQMVAH